MANHHYSAYYQEEIQDPDLYRTGSGTGPSTGAGYVANPIVHEVVHVDGNGVSGTGSQGYNHQHQHQHQQQRPQQSQQHQQPQQHNMIDGYQYEFGYDVHPHQASSYPDLSNTSSTSMIDHHAHRQAQGGHGQYQAQAQLHSVPQLHLGLGQAGHGQIHSSYSTLGPVITGPLSASTSASASTSNSISGPSSPMNPIPYPTLPRNPSSNDSTSMLAPPPPAHSHSHINVTSGMYNLDNSHGYLPTSANATGSNAPMPPMPHSHSHSHSLPTQSQTQTSQWGAPPPQPPPMLDRTGSGGPRGARKIKTMPTSSAGSLSANAANSPIGRVPSTENFSPISAGGNIQGTSHMNINGIQGAIPASAGNAPASGSGKKFTNACKRCRRQKMKCTFKPGASICSRCFLGSHQCVLEERKSRIPGALEVIRSRLRDTSSTLDQALDNLRSINVSQYHTPLSFVPGKLALTPEQRDELRDVLGNVVGYVGGRKTGGHNHGHGGMASTGATLVGSTGTSVIGTGAGGSAAGTSGGGGTWNIGGLEDVRALLMEEEDSEESQSDSDSDDGEGEDGSMDGVEEDGSESALRARRKASQTSLARSAATVVAAADGAGTGRHRFQALDAEESLLPNLDTPIGFIAQAALEEEADREGYFQSSPLKNPSLRSILIERGDEAPPILAQGLFTIKDVEFLFELYFKRIHPIVCVLDPAIHTPSSVLLRSSFLFTVICAIACRFADGSGSYLLSYGDANIAYADSSTSSTPTPAKSKSKKRSASEMESISPSTIAASSGKSRSGKHSSASHNLSSRYPLALHFAKVAAASALIDGRKNVEMVQAYILMALYVPNGKRFEESRTLFYSGVASTVALELGLDRVREDCPGGGSDERAAREWNNKIRTWIVCFNLDQCYGVQYGKPIALKEDFHVLNRNWHRVPFANSYDIHLHGHTDLLRIMARFHQSIRGEKRIERISALLGVFEKEVDGLTAELRTQYLAEADMSDEGCCFRLRLAEFIAMYSRLLILAHGLQQSFDNGSPPDPLLLTKALATATSAINTFVDQIASTGFWRYSPDCYFIYAGYCSTFLLKLIDSKFPYKFDEVQKERIVDLVSGLVGVLASPEVVIDDRHTPKLYAGFLEGLLSRVGKDVRERKRARLEFGGRGGGAGDGEGHEPGSEDGRGNNDGDNGPGSGGRDGSSRKDNNPRDDGDGRRENVARRQSGGFEEDERHQRTGSGDVPTPPSSQSSQSDSGATSDGGRSDSRSPMPRTPPTVGTGAGWGEGTQVQHGRGRDGNALLAFPQAQGQNPQHQRGISTTKTAQGAPHPMQGQSTGETQPPSSFTPASLNASTGMTWDDVYASPDTSSLSNLNLNPHSLPQTAQYTSGHAIYTEPYNLPPYPVNMGSQWHFSDTFNSPFNKWSMEELVPTVDYLMPGVPASAQSFQA